MKSTFLSFNLGTNSQGYVVKDGLMVSGNLTDTLTKMINTVNKVMATNLVSLTNNLMRRFV